MQAQSPAPGTRQTADKSVVTACVVAVAVFLGEFFTDRGVFTPADMRDALLTSLVVSGLGGGAAYVKANRPK